MTASAIQPVLLAGYARADITPAIGDPYRAGSKVREIVDPVTARVVYLEEVGGEGPIVLAMADFAGFTRQADRRVREAIARATGVPYERVRVNGSHNHTCPDGDWTAQEILAGFGIQHVSLEWLTRVAASLAGAALEAQAARRPAWVAAGMAPVTGVAANRSVPRPDGGVATRYGVSTSELRAAPGGLIDPDVVILGLRGEDGRPIVTIVNYACHVTSLPQWQGLISPDFPGYALDVVERESGGPGFFLQGAGGNVGTGKYADGTIEGARALGAQLAGSVLSAMARPVPCRPAPLRLHAWEEGVEVDPALPSEPEVRAELAALAAGRPQDAWRAAALLHVVSDLDAARRCQLFVLDGGDWCLAGLPAESFVEFGLAIRAASPKPFTLVGAYYDCTLWYIPTRKAVRDGGYEAHGGWRYVAAGAGERLAASVIQQLRPHARL